jgi:hypothetical protein
MTDTTSSNSTMTDGQFNILINLSSIPAVVRGLEFLWNENKALRAELAQVKRKTTQRKIEYSVWDNTEPIVSHICSIPSATEKGVFHCVRTPPKPGTPSCTCKGFQYTGRCKHLNQVGNNSSGRQCPNVRVLTWRGHEFTSDMWDKFKTHGWSNDWGEFPDSIPDLVSDESDEEESDAGEDESEEEGEDESEEEGEDEDAGEDDEDAGEDESEEEGEDEDAGEDESEEGEDESEEEGEDESDEGGGDEDAGDEDADDDDDESDDACSTDTFIGDKGWWKSPGVCRKFIPARIVEYRGNNKYMISTEGTDDVLCDIGAEVAGGTWRWTEPDVDRTFTKYDMIAVLSSQAEGTLLGKLTPITADGLCKIIDCLAGYVDK